MHWVDIIFLMLLFIAQPVFGAMSYKKYLRRIAEGATPDRIRLYQGTIVLQAAALLVLIVVWAVMDRPTTDLGLRMPDTQGLVIGLVVISFALVLLVWGLIFAKKLSAADRQRQVQGLGVLVHFLPQNDQELRYTWGLSIMAGIVEEIVYRGFVFWLLFLWMPVWAGVLIGSIGFGLAHSYQGIGGVLKTGTLGGVLGIVYLITGTIWIPVIIHALIDILQMATARELFREPPRVAAPA